MQETTPSSQKAIISSGTVGYVSFAFFLIITGIAVGLYVAIFFQNRAISTTQTEIVRLDGEISKASADSRIVIARIVEESGVRPSIDLKNIITQFRLAAIQSNVSFDGFSIKDDAISTQLISTAGTDRHPDAVGTIINMMNKYAQGDQSFRLGTISNVTGETGKRMTSIELKVLSTPNK